MSERSLEVNPDLPKQQSIEALVDVVASIDQYNRTHSLFGEFGAFIDTRAQQEVMETGTRSTPLDKLAEERENAFEAARANASKARSIGLGFDFGTDERIIFFGMGDDEGDKGKRPKELRLDLTDAAKFISFLRSLTPEDIDDKAIQHALTATSGILIRQLTKHYDVKKPDDRLIELLGNAESISNELKRLNVNEGVNILDQYLANARQKTLREFVGLRNTQALQKPEVGGFGPSEWHTDMTPELYKARWQAMSEALRDCLKNENAVPLVHEGIHNMINCAETAIKDMELKLPEQAKESHYAKVWPAMLEIARGQLLELQQLKKRMS